MKFETKYVVATFFEKQSEQKVGDKVIAKFLCKCGADFKQDLKKGFPNLMSHLKLKHPEWESVMESKTIDSKASLIRFVNKKATMMYSWIDWITGQNLPFSFVEQETTRRYSKLDSVSRNTLMKYIRDLTANVEVKIRSELPDRFGIVIDGWTEGSKHFVAVFAVYHVCGFTKTPLLTIAPPLDETRYDAESQKAFIEDVLEVFGKDKSSLLFMVGDNAPVNKRIADLLEIPIIGCASHRFNLACKRFLEPHEPLLRNINNLMILLRSIKKAGVLRQKTEKEPVKRNVTRWSSTFEMLSRFFELLPHLDQTDDEITDSLPSRQDTRVLQSLFEELKELEAVTKKLQCENLTLSDVRTLFDFVLDKYPSMDHYLASDSKFIFFPAFELGLVKIIEEDYDAMTADEKLAVSSFLKMNMIQESQDSDASCSIVERAMKAKKRKATPNLYVEVKYIPPTSNAAERLFSHARSVLTDYRKSMTPYHFECVMFLKANRSYWDIATVAEIVGK